MRANRTYGAQDDQPTVSLKADWSQGVNTLLPDDRLPPMQFKHGLNIGLRKGYPEIRPGVMRAKWLYTREVKLGENFQGWGQIQGVDPDIAARPPLADLVVCDNDLWLCAPNSEPILLMEDCTDNLQEVEIIDCFDFALILRGLGQVPLRYRYESGHVPEQLPAARAERTTLPPATTGVYSANRIWLKVGKNEVIASDIFQWDYDAVRARWQFDDGENDEIKRLWKVGEDRIIVFKERSVHVIEGASQLNLVATDDAPEVQIRQYRLAAARGLAAKWAVDQRGQTLFYLSRDGIEPLLVTDAGIALMGDKPISLPEKKYWDTVRWQAVEGAQLAIGDQYLMLSVPSRFREDEDIPSLTLGGGFSTPPDEEEGAVEYETVTIQFALGWNVDASGAPALTNYVEFPFRQIIDWRADAANPSVSYRLWYQGIVRVWESGTVQFIGQIKFVDGTTPTVLTEVDYNVWFGETGQPGSLETIATVPTDGNWYTVDWSGKPGASEHCEIIYGPMAQILGAIEHRAEILKYPDGLVIPDDPPNVFGGSAGDTGITACGLSRNGNDIDGEWLIAPGPFTTQHYIATVELDSSAWSYANAIVHLNASTLGGTLAGTFSRTIPDSATIGLWIRIWNASINVNTGTFDIGPFFRLGYAPSVQQGIDPEA